jgi:hypothetical protein
MLGLTLRGISRLWLKKYVTNTEMKTETVLTRRPSLITAIVCYEMNIAKLL